ncbi:hypothetical protein DRN44_09040 [Thermococci archaeon]|nr:MAG: hypothetical protein DRN44_09040 [Thermococci archaeon]
MKKRWIAIGIFLFLVLLVWLGKEPNNTQQKETTLTFEGQLEKELSTSFADIEKIEYSNITGHVNIYLVKEVAWDEKHLRESFIYACFDLMPQLLEHMDKIQSVTFVGKTTLVDAQGNKNIEKVFMADITMAHAKQVNWEGLFSVDPLWALNQNFDNIWWHPAVMP